MRGSCRGVGTALLLLAPLLVPLLGTAPAYASYPSTIQTQCGLQLDAFLAPAGFVNNAAMSVFSGVDSPDGTAYLSVSGHPRTRIPVTNGTASVALPADLVPGHTYLVRSRFVPEAGTAYKPCGSPVRTYTVTGSSVAQTVAATTLPIFGLVLS